MHHPRILTITSDGYPHGWISWEDAICLKVKNLISYEMGNDDEFFGGVSRMTGERSHITVGSIVGLKGKFRRNTKVPTLTNTNLFRRDLNICGYCGKRFNEHNLTRDHIIPVSKHGKDTWGNCISACKRCNSHKSNKLLEDCGMELLWLPYTPSREEALILSNRHILFDQAEFISGFLPKHSRAPRYLEDELGFKF